MSTLLIIAAVFMFSLIIFIVALWHWQRSPEAQLRKRLNEMIDQAEESRVPKMKKNLTPTSVAVKDGVPEIEEEKRISLYDRVVKPVVHVLEERMQKLTPAAIKEQIEDKIFRAGKVGSWSVARLATCWCLSIGIFTIGSIMLIQTRPGLNPAQQLLVMVLGITIGAGIPFAVLNSKIRERQNKIRKQLPEFLDMLCVSVQAGLSFDGAVSKMIKRMKGPLIDEFNRMQQDVALGMTHQYALTSLAKRCDLEEVYLFTTSVIQAEKLGTSMTRTLKTQADNMRDRHRQWVKTEAMKAPVKILFPMILFIFPSMFVVLLFPAMYTLMQNLGNR